MKKTEFVARYTTNTMSGWTVYETENEMYADLEVQGLVEENDRVVGINYYEICDHNILRSWDFGKPWTEDSWRQ